MKKFTIHLMTPHATWEGVESENEQTAINEFVYPVGFNLHQYHEVVALEEVDDRARCLICEEPIEEGDKVTEFEEGHWLSGDLVDKESHYLVHSLCLFNLIRKEKEDAESNAQ